jgi:p-hydroxybenzoate 3-monooxygenase
LISVPAHPVAIVGAGPAGLVLAHLLARARVPFVQLERQARAELARLPKAGLVEYRTVRLLREVGLAPSVLRFTEANERCEFRTPDESVVLDYARLTEGRPHYVYPQHELVERLADALPAGADVRYRHTVEAVRRTPDGVAVTALEPGGRRLEVTAEVVIGCDGARGLVGAAMPGASVREKILPARWLVVVAHRAPLADHTIYAAHPRGFATHIRRGAEETRYYLEASPGDGPAVWAPDRVRRELGERLGMSGELDDLPLGDVGFLDLRMRVREPMGDGAVFLAGDAAHLITPAGGKGMNLAIQDAVELAYGLIDRFRHADPRRLDAYSATRLPAIWRAQAFSSWFLRLILSGGSGESGGRTESDGFDRGLREGWISALRADPALAAWFAHAYAGVDPGS